MKLKILLIVLCVIIFTRLEATDFRIEQRAEEMLISQMLQDIKINNAEISQEEALSRLIETAKNSNLLSSEVFGVGSWETVGILLGVGALICCVICSCGLCGLCATRKFCKSVLCCGLCDPGACCCP